MSESPQVKECTDELLRELTKVVVSPIGMDKGLLQAIIIRYIRT